MLENKKRALAFTRPGVGGVRGRSASHENVAMTQAQEMMMRHSLNDGANTNIDPFLASSQPGETHNRQESADSGLGMGSNFNLGSIPEDMGLETMDTADLDTTLTESNQVNIFVTINNPSFSAMRSSILDVWMMILYRQGFSEC